MITLDARSLRHVLTSDLPAGDPSEVATRQILSATIDQSLVTKISHCESAQQIWQCLRSLFENNTSFALTDMISKMNSFKMRTLDDVEIGVSEIRSLASQINAMGGKVDRSTIESAILRALPYTFESFISSWSFFDEEKRTIENLQAHLLQAVARMRSRQSLDHNKQRALAIHSPSTDKSKPSSSSTNSATKIQSKTKKLFCRYCKKPNHEINECRKLKRKRESESKDTKNDVLTASPTSLIKSPEPSDKDDKQHLRVAYGHLAKVTIPQPNESSQQYSDHSEYVDSLWFADTAASFHMTSHLEWISNYFELTEKIDVILGDDRVIKAVGRGFIETSIGVLDPVYYLPEIKVNLFSQSSCAKNNKIFALSTDKEIVFLSEGKEVFKGRLNPSGVYEVNFKIRLARFASLLSTTLLDWHDRLGHCSFDTIKHMAKNNIVDDLSISGSISAPVCEACAKNRVTHSPHPTKTSPRASLPGQVLHLDTVGPFSTPSLGENRYYVLCKDSFSSYKKVFFVQLKSEIPNEVKIFINQAKLETGNDVLKIVTDQGSEFLNHNLNEFLKEKGIDHELSATYTAQQNGLIEREIRTVAEAAGCLRTKANLPREYWAEAVNTSVYLLNRVVNVRNRDSTPYELWFNRKPNIKNLRRFGERAIVYQEKHLRDKLDEKGIEMIFVGFTTNFNTLRFIEPKTFRLFIICNYRFLDNTNYVPTSNDTGHDSPSEVKVSIPFFIPRPSDTAHNPDPQKPSLPNVTFSIDGDGQHDEELVSTSVVTNMTSPTNRTFDITRSLSPETSNRADFETPARLPPEVGRDENRLATLRPRISRPNYMNWKLNLSTVEADSDPQTFEEATSRPDSDKWLAAMQEELESLAKNDVWTLVDRPRNCNIVSNRWVYRIKRSPEGKIERYRARLVARGFSQVEGVDYFETYAPTANMVVVRTLFAYAAIEGLHVQQFDIKAAFLYGDLEETVYMHQPAGFAKGDKVCLLKRSLYGLKQAPRQWCRKFSEFLLETSLVVSSEDRCVFYKLDPFLALVIYVDDGILFARHPKDADELIDKLSKRFELHNMALSTFLGSQVERPHKHQIILHQKSYINKILTKLMIQKQRDLLFPPKACVRMGHHWTRRYHTET